MARGNPKPVKSWIPGQSGNPSGSNGFLSREFRAEIAKNKSDARKLILQYLKLSESQYLERQSTPDVAIFERMLAACVQKIIETGDVNAFKAIFELAFGKITDDQTDFETLTADEQLMILKYRKALKKEETVIET